MLIPKVLLSLNISIIPSLPPPSDEVLNHMTSDHHGHYSTQYYSGKNRDQCWQYLIQVLYDPHPCGYKEKDENTQKKVPNLLHQIQGNDLE